MPAKAKCGLLAHIFLHAFSAEAVSPVPALSSADRAGRAVVSNVSTFSPLVTVAPSPPGVASIFAPLWRRVSIEEYLIWTYTAPSPARPRLFLSPLLERLTKTAPAIIPALWLPVVLFCCVTASVALPAWALAALFACGWAYWYFLEYALHRKVFHLDLGLPPFAAAIALHFLFHGVHHKFPKDVRTRLWDLWENLWCTPRAFLTLLHPSPPLRRPIAL